MTLISLLMNIFRNINDRAFCQDLVKATIKDVAKIEVKYGENAIANLEESQIFRIYGYDFKETDAVLTKWGISIIPMNGGWKVQGMARNLYSWMPLGCCIETYSSRGDCLAAIMDILDQSRLKAVFDEEVNNILNGDLITAIGLFL